MIFKSIMKTNAVLKMCNVCPPFWNGRRLMHICCKIRSVAVQMLGKTKTKFENWRPKNPNRFSLKKDKIPSPLNLAGIDVTNEMMLAPKVENSTPNPKGWTRRCFLPFWFHACVPNIKPGNTCRVPIDNRQTLFQFWKSRVLICSSQLRKVCNSIRVQRQRRRRSLFKS